MGLQSGVLIVRVLPWAVVALILVVAVGACASPEPSPSVPAEGRAAMDECMAAAGFVVHPARSGSNGVYSWERPSYYSWEGLVGDAPDGAAAAACKARFAPPREETDAELLEIYNRWLLERACLISLGFSPSRPPPFGEFRRDWETWTWTPIDGIPFDRITGEAKERCGLEMID